MYQTRSLPWILFFPGIDPLPHAVVVYEILDKDLRFAAPTLLGLVPAPDEPVHELVDSAHLADVEATAGHHLRVREGELAHLAEECRGALDRGQLWGRRREAKRRHRGWLPRRHRGQRQRVRCLRHNLRSGQIVRSVS